MSVACAVIVLYDRQMSTSAVVFSQPLEPDIRSTPGPALPDSGLTLLARLEIARELVGALEQATGAGQPHVMDRVARILRRATLSISPRAAVTGIADALEREVSRVAPDLEAFRERAARLVDLIERELAGPSAAQGGARQAGSR